jgi:hypothetical protein
VLEPGLLVIHDQLKWITAPCPCPECTELAHKKSYELGAEMANAYEQKMFDIVFGGDDGNP